MDYFKFLPLEITLDILTRLPAESIMDCKSVSKSWTSAVGHPSFSKLRHLNHPADDKSADETREKDDNYPQFCESETCLVDLSSRGLDFKKGAS
ncbi:probable F-box protein At1g53815 [Papaver somniferum]|uniref:probable F-box protein At1g53815 n=1 Tax=Papaver somniferum TaxID=3469 RepID=UPI000E6F50B6|nr:probable F-box protein At1g53815 [Papaver somniferum]